MRTKLRGKFSLLFVAFAALLAVPAVALADRFDADADTLATATPAANTQSVNQQPGTTKTYDFSAAITNTGSTADNVFAASGDTVTVNNLFEGDWVNASSSTSSFSFTAYNQNKPGTISVSVPCDATTMQAVTVTLTATASNGQTLNNNPQTVTYSVTPTGSPNPSCPTANAGGSYSGNENTNIALSGSGTDPENGPLTYAWDLDNDGQFDDSEDQNPTFAAPAVEADTVFTVKLRVTDNQGLTDTDTATVTVRNVVNTAPMVSVTGVTNDGSYEIGSEPNAGCSVTDTEDGSAASANPVINRDALNSFGLGTVTVTCSYEDTGGLADSDEVSYTIVDTTDPTASHQLSAAANGNGWHKADFTVTLNGSDSGSGVREIRYTINGGTEQVASGSSTQISVNTEGIKNISYHSVDNAGNDSAEGSVTVRLDKTPPTIDGSASPLPNGAGWNNTNVTVSFQCDDTLSGVPSGTCPANVSLESDGADQSVTRSVTDAAGNSASDTVSNIDIDKTAPTVTVTGVSNNATYNLGSVPAAGCTTMDSLSGKAQDATVNVTGGTTNGVGTFTATCSGGKDVADNTRAPVSVTYKVLYVRDGGILQPINYDSSSIFSRGKAVPVKFKLAGDEPLGFSVSGWTLTKVSVSCTAFDSVDAEVEQIADNPSQTFRYDSSADQYIINADFKSAAVGSCWKARVTFHDGTTLESSVFKMQK